MYIDDLSPLLGGLGILGIVIVLLPIVLFILLVANVVSINNKFIEVKAMLEMKHSEEYYECKTCQYTSSQAHEFCPVCGIGYEGKTLEQLKKEYLTRS